MLKKINIYSKIYLYPTEDGGRKRPIVSGYRSNIGFETGKITDAICLFEGEPIKPGETRNITLSFFADSFAPKTSPNFTLFTLQEGGKKIGHGVILKNKRQFLMKKEGISV